MPTYRDIVEAFFNLKEAHNESCERHYRLHYVDEVGMYKDAEHYWLHGFEFAVLHPDRMLQLRDRTEIREDIYLRLIEISRILRERYGIYGEPMLFDVADITCILYRYGNVAYVFWDTLEIDLERKTVVNASGYYFKIYPVNSIGIKMVMELDIDNGFALAIGATEEDIVVRISRCSEHVLRKLVRRKNTVKLLTEYWIELQQEVAPLIRDLITLVNRSAKKEYDALLKILGYE